MIKNIIVGIFLVVMIISAIIFFMNKKPNEKMLDNKPKYIEDCIRAIKTSKITNQQKRDMCNCSFDSLYIKYADRIFEDDFVFSKADSAMMINCAIIYLKIDSIKN